MAGRARHVGQDRVLALALGLGDHAAVDERLTHQRRLDVRATVPRDEPCHVASLRMGWRVSLVESFDGAASGDRKEKPTVQEWRLARFKERVGQLFPSGLSAEGMTQKRFGFSVLRVLKLAVEKEALNFHDRRIVWALATHYKDGQAMVTAALVVCATDNSVIEPLLKGWEFHSTPDAPHRLDMPALSTLERLTLESNDDVKAKMAFDLPKSDMGEDPITVFKKFYRIYPHFSRVEL